MLLEHPRGRIWLRRNTITAWDVIRREFEDRHVQAFMIWQAFQTLVPADAAGSGVNAYSIIFGRQGRSWSIPRGGSGALTEALARFLEAHGSTVLTNRQVTRLVLEDGRCTGVETDDGGRYIARRAMLSTIHVKHLAEMAPPDAWGEEFRYGVDTYDVGMSGMACYLATDAVPEFQTPYGPRAAVSAGPGGGAAHGQAAEPADLGPAGGRLELGRAQGDDLPAPARARAPFRAGPRRRAHPHVLCEEPGGHRAVEPAHDPRGVPRRGPVLRLQREEPARARLRRPPHADPGALPDGGHDERGRLRHRRAGAQCGDRDADRPRPRSGGGDGRCRTRACRQPLTIGRRASCRREWTTTTSWRQPPA